MMHTDPQQELFTRLLLNIKDEGYDVYDGALPPDGTPYPFVYLGDFTQIDDANKTAVFGTVNATIHVFCASPTQRGTLSMMMLTIKSLCRTINYTNNFSWHVRGINQRILPDNTTKTPLLHGVIETEFVFS